MAKLLKINNRIANAKNFRESLARIDPIAENLYLYFGQSAPWSNESIPDVPSEDITDEFDTRSKIIGIKKILASSLAFTVPRYTWTPTVVYSEYDPSDALLSTKNFYVITSSNNVYKCLDNNGGAASIIEPTGTSTSAVSTGDGYTWKFMYNLSSEMISNFLTSDWLPIPFGNQKTSFQTSVEAAASYSAGTPVGGHGANAVEELFGRRLMITAVLDKDESGTFPVNDDYRTFGLWLNPKLLSTGALATATRYSVNDSNSDINEKSGSILYVDNRSPITRSPEQLESFKLIMSF